MQPKLIGQINYLFVIETNRLLVAPCRVFCRAVGIRVLAVCRAVWPGMSVCYSLPRNKRHQDK